MYEPYLTNKAEYKLWKENGGYIINFRDWLIANKGNQHAATGTYRTDSLGRTESGSSSRTRRREISSQRGFGTHIHMDRNQNGNRRDPTSVAGYHAKSGRPGPGDFERDTG
jgi:hypothetical protein